jgi:hypothetical protein
MTKEQAREYATRIRLGEPVYFAWPNGDSGELAYAAGFRDGTIFACRRAGGNWDATLFPEGGLVHTHQRRTGSVPHILAALDRTANAD